MVTSISPFIVNANRLVGNKDRNVTENKDDLLY